MDVEIEEFRTRCTAFARNRQISIGMALDLSFLATLPGKVENEAGFKQLVSTAYKLWWETWKLDVRFLIGHSGQSGARDFNDLINTLRTSHQHADVKAQNREADDWAKKVCDGRIPNTSDDWTACGVALMKMFNKAVGALCQIITQKQSKGFRTAWQTKVAVSEEAIVARVAADLGVRLNDRTRGLHIHQVKRRWASYRPRRGEVAEDVLAAFAEESLISWTRKLPCSYFDVLNNLEILGKPEAVPALRLAHAVAEITHAVGESYMKRLSEVWTLLRD